MKVVKLSALRTGRLYPPGNITGTHLFERLSRPQGLSAAGRMTSMKNSSDIIGNQTRDPPACGAVLQPTALSRAPPKERNTRKIRLLSSGRSSQLCSCRVVVEMCSLIVGLLTKLTSFRNYTRQADYV